jgi:hypothetical protein
MKESTIERYLNSKVQSLGGHSFKWCSPMTNGVPDRIVFINKQIWFIELKNEQGELSRLQVHMAKIIKSYTPNYTVLRSKSDVDRFINEVCTTTT